MPEQRAQTWLDWGQACPLVPVVAVAVSAPVALAFGLVLEQSRAAIDRYHAVSYGAVGPLICGLVAVGLYLGVGLEPQHVLGMGEHTIHAILQGSAHGEGLGWPWWLLLLALVARMLTTGLTIQSGGSAGMLIPSMCFGGISGAAVAVLLGHAGIVLDPSVFVVAGIASALVAVVGVPLAAIALVLEVFGPQYGPPAILACGVTYVLTLRFSVYAEQRRP